MVAAKRFDDWSPTLDGRLLLCRTQCATAWFDHARTAADMGTGLPPVLDAGAIFWMFCGHFAVRTRRSRDRNPAFNRVAEECLPNGEYLSATDRHQIKRRASAARGPLDHRLTSP
jgi:hypothetical protein